MVTEQCQEQSLLYRCTGLAGGLAVPGAPCPAPSWQDVGFLRKPHRVCRSGPEDSRCDHSRREG
jgi:hypothetical protein